MATNTNGGTTASLSNTPQAQGDTFYKDENLTGIALLDVMSNDLAGKAKILWSLDDSATDLAGATDLITTDVGKIESTTADTSANGAKIWIQDGKVAYQSDTLSAAFKASLQALAVGETATDTFTYAIRMSNGTLSWATATVVYTGANDVPVAQDDSASGNEDTLITGNVGDNDDDVDNGAVLTFTVNGTAPAGFTMGLDGAWQLDATHIDYQHIAQGAYEDVVVSYTVTDEHGATDTATLTIRVYGANDNASIVIDANVTDDRATVEAGGAANATPGDPSASGKLTVSDVDD
ncbi:MAG TPA: Ig-like domain-containing protein, partial [Sphingomicrobium sp.]|nr:Ig-like domain-containing protein [Sphingomicrobium sp.]